jgi:hypothetical protein
VAAALAFGVLEVQHLVAVLAAEESHRYLREDRRRERRRCGEDAQGRSKFRKCERGAHGCQKLAN